jgi:hypothetical protein
VLPPPCEFSRRSLARELLEDFHVTPYAGEGETEVVRNLRLRPCVRKPTEYLRAPNGNGRENRVTVHRLRPPLFHFAANGAGDRSALQHG